METEIVIEPDGQIRCIYDDSLRDLMDQGTVNIRRASSVEPAPDGTWQVDLSPVGGGVMAGFRLREDALKAEVEWIRKNWL